MFKELKRISLLSIHVLKTTGLRFLLKEIIRYIRFGPIVPVKATDYKDFLIKYYPKLSQDEILYENARLSITPMISIVVPVYNVEKKWLDKCIQSVRNQYYPNWELCLYDDASTNKETKQALIQWENIDPRMRIFYGETNQHISLATNAAIARSQGEFIALLDNDDELNEDALLEVVKVLNANNDIDFIYSDEDFINEEGEMCNPHFKSDFNLELLLSHNYITHFAVIRKTVGSKIGWFRKGVEGAQDHDLFLRITEITNKIHHIPRVLYHWRQTSTSTALNYSEKSYANSASIKTLQDYAQRNNIEVDILHGPGTGAYRFKRKVTTTNKISIIIPFRDQVSLLKPCVESIFSHTKYENIELILVSNNSEKRETFKFLEKIQKKDSRIKLLEYNKPFNYSAINNWAVQHSTGEYILLLNNDTKVISDSWLESMLEFIQDEKTGIVGAKLLYKDKTIQHAGVIVGISGIAGHSHRFFPDQTNGYYYRPSVVQNLTAVTGACLLTKKTLWNHVGGLDEENFKIAFNDIDFCLKIRKAGYNIVYTPYSKLFHYESKSRGYEDTPEKKMRFDYECKLLQEKWGTNNYTDPYYNINLTLNFENFNVKG